ncbi:MAG: tetratricopeptide repeat protein [Treponema sp.]|nr:tetratricopeptide repeat protein [Treponema sp.]
MVENKELTEEEKEERRKKIIIISSIAGGFIVLIILILLLIFGLRGSAGKTRTNICNLAKTYADRGDYDRALNKLDNYLEKHGDDDEVWDLWNQILDMKKAAENGEKPAGFGNPYGDLNINVDTKGISDAMKSSVSSMKDALDEANRQTEENRKAMENLMRMQEEQKAAEEKRRAEDAAKAAADAEAKRQADAERAAKEAAAAEAKRIAEEKRKAEEAELAKKNAALKKQIDEVNDAIKKGESALASGDIAGAMEYFQKAQGHIPGEAGKEFAASKNSEIAQALYDAADKAESPEKKAELMREAVSLAEKALASNPKDAGAHYIIAQNSINNKDYNTALAEMTAAVQNAPKDDPNRYLYYYELGKLQYRFKKYVEAAASFTTSCELKGDFAPSRYNLGVTQKQLKNETAALAAFRKTIDIDPRHEKAYLEQARLLTSRGDYTGAIESYNSVLKINNINVQAAMELGSVYYQKKNYAEAEDSFRRALTMLSPCEEMTLTKYNLSTVLFDAGKILDAEKYAREAYEGKDFLKSKNAKANIVYNYALILEKNGKGEAAIPYYTEVLNYNPDHTKTKINLGVMYMSIEPADVDTAMALFTQVYQKENGNFEANNNLGSAYLLKEDYSNSIKFYQNALKIDSKNNAVRANLAKAYAKNSDYDNAKTTYTELLKYDKENWDAYIELGKVCMQLGDNTNAEKYFIYVQEKNSSYRAAEVSSLLSSLN